MKRPIHSGPRFSGWPRGGFSLIELLVVASLIATLCMLAFTGVRSMQRHADMARCASNLRQIGAGVMLFAADNDSRLPGPTYAAQGPLDAIAGSIDRYLNDTGSAARIFTCPACEKSVDYDPSKKPFYCGKTTELQNGSTVYAFGLKRNPLSSSASPVRLTDIKTPTQTAALTDLDFPLSGNAAGVSKPSHEKFRNTLYFDGHVQAILIPNP